MKLSDVLKMYGLFMMAGGYVIAATQHLRIDLVCFGITLSICGTMIFFSACNRRDE